MASTKEGWIVRKKQLEIKLEFIIGDCLMTAAFMSYSGPFPSEYRDAFMKELFSAIKSLKINHSKDY